MTTTTATTTAMAEKLRALSLDRTPRPAAAANPAPQARSGPAPRLQSLTLEKPPARLSALRSRLVQGLGAGTLGIALVAALTIGLWQEANGTSVPAGDVLPARQSPAAATTPARAAPASGLVAAGFVVPRRGGTIGSQVTGQLAAFLVEEGDNVRAGEVVARIEDAEARARLARAVAEAARARAEAKGFAFESAEAKSMLARREALVTRGFVSMASLDESRARSGALGARIDQARANVAAFDADVQLARLQLERHAIRAPFAGVVINKNAQVGELVSPVSAGGGFTRTGVVTIVDMASLAVEVDVNEAFIGGIRTGQPVTLSFDALPGERFKAVVAAIVPSADRNRATVRVGIDLLQADPRILPQMAAKAAFLALPKGG